MKTNHNMCVLTVAFVLSAILLSACNRLAGYLNKGDYPCVHLFLEPTEEHLLNGSCIPDFVNYPDDRTKFGLKDDVCRVEYTSLHRILWQFYKSGEMATQCTIISGGWAPESTTWAYLYENDSVGGYDIPNLGHPTGVSVKTELLIKGRSQGKKESLHDDITYNDAGQPASRSYYLFKNVSYTKLFNYNENGRCTTMSLAESAMPTEPSIIDCNISCDEFGTVSHIYLKNARIPVHGLTKGERDITPMYNNDGKLSTVKCLSIPHNMEAYDIDSIRSTSQYEYNKQGDVTGWHYTDTIYPRQIVNDFTLTFNYTYDTHGNWIEKQIVGQPHLLEVIMNGYYRAEYPIQVTVDDQGQRWGTITIKRKITYFSEEVEEKANEEVTEQSATPKRQEEASSQKTSAVGLSNQIKFVSENLGAWKIKKITCKGQQGGGYAFIISGVFLENCENYSMGTRSKTIGVKENNSKKLTSVGAYIFPGGKAGDSFSFEIVGAFDGMCNINDFEHLAILDR